VRFKLDENMPLDAAGLLRQAGHDCHTVYDEALTGARDEQVIVACRTGGHVLVTLDLDFADIRLYPPADSPGAIVLRPAEPDAERVMRLLARAIKVLETEPIERRLWIVEEDRIRVRRSDTEAV
jgi:predicted nuclease of predicted toxin-antitoxin system